MRALYVDDSGSAGNSKESYFVLAGVAVFERRLHQVIAALDRVVAAFGFADPHEVELHGTAMYSGHNGFYAVKRPEREKMVHEVINVTTDRRAILRFFAIAVDKQVISPRDPVEVAFEEISNRFNLFQYRLNNANGPEQSQRGLIVMDESAHEGRLQSLARHYRINGRWGH